MAQDVKNKGGRPNTGKSKYDKTILARVTDAEKIFIQKEADEMDLSVNDFIRWVMFEVYPSYRDGMIESNSILVNRINQLIDLQIAGNSNVANLEDVVLRGFNSLIGLTRGDNYLIEDDDGSLS